MGLNILKILRFVKEDFLIGLGTSSSEAAMPTLMEKLGLPGRGQSLVGLTVPLGYAFNLDGSSIYFTTAIVFITQALNIPLSRAASPIGTMTHSGFVLQGLNLAIAAIVYWNSTYIVDAIAHLRDRGQPMPQALRAHTLPLAWGHIGFSGDFL